MTLIQLRYLVAIVDAGLNITVAARQVNATQPGLSKQLKQIEEELGFQLFIRRGKSLEGISLAGSEVVERARTILAEAANINTFAANHRQDARGVLRIATTHTQARYVLPGPLASVKARFPELTLQLAPLSEREALGRIEQQVADVAIVSSPERPPTSDLVLPLYRWNLIGLADRVLTGAEPPLSLAGLARLPLVTYESALDPQSSFARAFADVGLSPRVACAARDSDLIKTYVRTGMGLGVLAEMAVTEADGDLRRFDLDGLFPVRTAWAVLRRDRILRDHLLEFLGAVAPHLDRADLRKAVDGGERNWPPPPHWRDLVAGEGPGTARVRSA